MGEERKRFVYDVVVVGGGIAGICAAVSAARNGAKTLLVHDRPVLGGNASSEIRVWMCGAVGMGNNRFAAESGIIGELDLENLWRNPSGSPVLWDALLLDVVKREANLSLLLNTQVFAVSCTGTSVRSVMARNAAAQELELAGRFFIDCTGDGTVGFLAGVPYRQGREASSEFGESLAPKKADTYTMGSSLLYYVRDAGRPVRYVPPDFAYSVSYIRTMLQKNKKVITPQTTGCDLWWLEYGGTRDTIEDSAEIQAELQKLVYGLWNYIKNSGEFEAETLELEWVGSLPGKRESRRFMGKHVLTQNDIVSHRDFSDAVCCGGWPIDTHPPQGIYSKESSCTQIPAGVYQIPLSCLYSEAMENLLFAGRNVSVTHTALASTRVMKTCGAMGQAAGTAAACLARDGKTLHGLTDEVVRKIQRVLRHDDMWIVNAQREMMPNKAAKASIEVSSVRPFAASVCNCFVPLVQDAYILFPQIEHWDSFELALKSDCGTDVQVSLFEKKDIWSVFLTDQQPLSDQTVFVRGECRVKFFEGIAGSGLGNLLIRIRKNPLAELGTAKDGCCGVVGSWESPAGMKLFHPSFSIAPTPHLFEKENLCNGKNRPCQKPNLWISQKLQKDPAWIRLCWEKEEHIQEIVLRFNPDFNRDYNNLCPDFYKNGWNAMPEDLVREYRVWAETREGMRELCHVADNIRANAHIKTDIAAHAIQVEILATYGSPYAQVFSVEVY